MLSGSADVLALGLQRLAESFWFQVRVFDILVAAGYSDDLMQGYFYTLDLCNPDGSSNATIQKEIWAWFDDETDPMTVLQLKIAFKEEDIVNSMGSFFPILHD